MKYFLRIYAYKLGGIGCLVCALRFSTPLMAFALMMLSAAFWALNEMDGRL